MRPLALLLLLAALAQPAGAAEPPASPTSPTAPQTTYPIWDVDDFVELYPKEVARSQLLLLVGGISALFLLGVVLFRAIRKRQRFQFSLGWLPAFVLALSVALCGGVGWWRAEKPDPGDVEFKKAVEAAMEEPISVNFGGDDLASVVRMIHGRGVYIFLSPELAGAQKTVSLKPVRTPRREAIRQVCELVGAGCDVRNGAMLVYPEGKRPPIRRRFVPEDEWEAAVAKKLSRRLTFDLWETPMTDAIALTSDLANVPISFAPDLHAEDVLINACNVKDIRADDALTWFCLLADAEWTLTKSADGVGEIRIVTEWPTVFGDERLTGALLDRLTHHVHVLEVHGDSYRLKNSLKVREQRRAAAADKG